jgi:DNA-binding CsgD family transcriptional regulator
MSRIELEEGFMTDVIRENRGAVAYMALFVAIALMVGIDLIVDYQSGTSAGHVVFEGIVFVCALVGAGVLGRRLLAERREAGRRSRQLQRELDVSRADAHRWREEAQQFLRGLSQAIEAQFERWELTPAEKEVALLMLKGLSHKEIAQVRGVSDRTVRQQAHVVYTKAGLDGRADLAAFFLEDLLLPTEQDALEKGSAA